MSGLENSNTQESIKKFQLRDMPKRNKYILVAVLVAVVAIAAIFGGSNKLSGSYLDGSGMRYEFQIADTNSGDYGGVLNRYHSNGELEGSFSWYVMDDMVYINGKQQYHYDGTYLYGLSTIDWITIEEDNYLSGSNQNWANKKTGGILFTNFEGRDCLFYDYGSWGLSTYIVEGTYTIENNIIKIYDEDGDTEYIYIIVNDVIYNNVLIPA